MSYDISRIKNGELPNLTIYVNLDEEANTHGIDYQFNITRKNTGETKFVDLRDSLQKDETEAIVLAIDEDDDGFITSEEIENFAANEDFQFEAITLEAIVQEAINSFDAEETEPEAETIAESAEAENNNNDDNNMEFNTATVDAWGTGSNDCLDHIMKNYYQSVTPYSDEWFELETQIMDANPEIYGGVDANGNEIAGRTRLNDKRHSAVIHAGDEIKLPKTEAFSNNGVSGNNNSSSGEYNGGEGTPVSDELVNFMGLELSDEELNSLRTGNENVTLQDGTHIGVLTDDYVIISTYNEDGSVNNTKEIKRDSETGNFIVENTPANGYKTIYEYGADGELISDKNRDAANNLFNIGGFQLSDEEYQALYYSENTQITRDDGTKIIMNNETNFVIQSADGTKMTNVYATDTGYTVDAKLYQGDTLTISKENYNNNGQIYEKTEWCYYDEESRKNNTPSQINKYDFDENGNEIGERTYDADGTTLRIERTPEGYVNFYDENGILFNTTNPGGLNAVDDSSGNANSARIIEYSNKLNGSNWDNNTVSNIMNDTAITCGDAKAIFDRTENNRSILDYNNGGKSITQEQITALSNMIERSDATETAKFITSYPLVRDIQEKLSMGKETASLKTYFNALNTALNNSGIALDTTSEHIENIVLRNQSSGNYFKPILDSFDNGELSAQEALGAFYNKYNDTNAMIDALRNLGNKDQEKYGSLLEKLYSQVLSGN